MLKTQYSVYYTKFQLKNYMRRLFSTYKCKFSFAYDYIKTIYFLFFIIIMSNNTHHNGKKYWKMFVLYLWKVYRWNLKMYYYLHNLCKEKCFPCISGWNSKEIPTIPGKKDVFLCGLLLRRKNIQNDTFLMVLHTLFITKVNKYHKKLTFCICLSQKFQAKTKTSHLFQCLLAPTNDITCILFVWPFLMHYSVFVYVRVSSVSSSSYKSS